MSESPADASLDRTRARGELRLGRRAVLPAAALVVYVATSWLARVDLAVPAARRGELPAVVAEAARLERPSPVRASAEAPERPLAPVCEDGIDARQGQGAATVFQHASLAGSAGYSDGHAIADR